MAGFFQLIPEALGQRRIRFIDVPEFEPVHQFIPTRTIEPEEAPEMDQDTLEEMARVYMTDRGCKAAVEGYVAAHGGTVLDAARKVAKMVAPAPHSTAAHDARYLLAPEAEHMDSKRIDLHLGSSPSGVDAFDAVAREERLADAALEENEGIGPVPPHPNEAPDERRRFSEVRTFTALERAAFPAESQLATPHTCGPFCRMVSAMNAVIREADRIPVSPPTVIVDQVGSDYTVSVTVDTVPNRRRDMIMLAGFGDPETIDAQIAEWVVMMERYPTHRIVVRRNPAEDWVSAVIYRPIEPEEGLTPEEVRMAMFELFGIEVADVDILPGGVAVLSLFGMSDDTVDIPEPLGENGPPV